METPFYVGCFEVFGDINFPPIIAGEGDVVSPAWCLTQCLSGDKKLRFASK